MRQHPSIRIPIGILGLLLGLAVYAGLIAAFVPNLIGKWPIGVQAVIYLFLGVIWLTPLRRFLIWMEGGKP